MNFRLVVKLLGIICFLIGVTMLFCLPWAFPILGHRTDSLVPLAELRFEDRGFFALGLSTLICFAVAGGLMYRGRRARGQIFRREAMAIVGLSWVLASILGALPFLLSSTYRGCSIRVFEEDSSVVYVSKFNWNFFDEWYPVEVDSSEAAILSALVSPPNDKFPRKAKGLTLQHLVEVTGLAEATLVESLEELLEKPSVGNLILTPDSTAFPFGANGRYRLRWVRMGVFDSLFESQSGFSTTGATVIGHLEEPVLVPHCILVWRSVTHFLGGLGIIVLFVVILGEGTAGKTLMRSEVPGPIDSNPTARMRHAAIMFAGIYVVLNIAMTLILIVSGQMNAFDAITHAFATLATGGFSTYDTSIGHFNSSFIDYLIILFMILAGTNFTLIYFFFVGRPGPMLRDVEWRTYICLIFGVSIAIVIFGMSSQDSGFETLASAIRYSLFQVVSITTTTGFGTNDFDQWNNFGRCSLLLLMFIGGCAGSTGGGMKVIRHVLFVKILRLEVEKAFRPRVVRKLQLGDRTLEDSDMSHTILVYFALIMILFGSGWLYVVALEPADTWGAEVEHKLVDSASAVAATLNNIGPGLGTVGASRNYGHFSSNSKFIFLWLMMLGRLELFVVLVLFVPHFWRGYH